MGHPGGRWGTGEKEIPFGNDSQKIKGNGESGAGYTGASLFVLERVRIWPSLRVSLRSGFIRSGWRS
jgi:hypothetical protein